MPRQPRPLITAEPRTLITRRYSQVKELRARGLMSAAGPPCDLGGCPYSAGQPQPRYRTVYVYEHCHRHDYIRGIACGQCNGLMGWMDARLDRCPELPRFGAYLAWWQRCPECAAGPPWEPWLTRAEHAELPLLAALGQLGRAEPGSPAAAEALRLAALHGDGIIRRDRLRVRLDELAAARRAAPVRSR